jgi:anion-transporting  ArsA/GET3 family ATPase
VSDADRVGALVDGAEVLVCVGTGGVGKTTTAAALALEGARRGRRTVVVTIDPARRLADALGLGSLSNDPSPVDLGPVTGSAGGTAAGASGTATGGSLHALMLDTATTFDDLVTRHAADADQARRILANRFYRNISRSLSGTREYMAGEKLHELHRSGRFDLIVVDTPPSRNALDFLDAPHQLVRLLDHRVFRALTTPARGVGRVVNRAAHTVARTGARAVGAEVVDDVVAFFAAFEGMEAGFRDRSERVATLLGSTATSFVLVASPRPDTVVEAAFFSRRLAQRDLEVGALVVNRVHPDFGAPATAPTEADADAAGGSPLALLRRNLADFVAVAAREHEALATLRDEVAPAPVVQVPLLDEDVHDLTGLERLIPYLVGDGRRLPPGRLLG